MAISKVGVNTDLNFPFLCVAVCEYFVHVDCEDFVVPNCKDCAIFILDKTLPQVVQQHHWREGNLPANSKCVVSDAVVMKRQIICRISMLW